MKFLIALVAISSLVLATPDYVGMCNAGQNCTLQEFVVSESGGNKTPVTGASLQFQIWNSTGLVVDYNPLVEVGGGYYNATINLSAPGVYMMRINGSYSGLSSADTILFTVGPSYSIGLGSGAMDFWLWFVLMVSAGLLVALGYQYTGRAAVVMGGIVALCAALIWFSLGVSYQGVALSDPWSKLAFGGMSVILGGYFIVAGASAKELK